MDEPRTTSAGIVRQEASTSDRWRALAAATHDIAGAGSADAILAATAKQALVLTGAALAVAGLAAEEAAAAASPGIDAAGPLCARVGTIDPEARRRAISAAEPLRLARTGLADAPGGAPLEGWLGVPLPGPPGGEGGIVEVAGKPGGFDDADEAIVAQLAAVAAVALENARMVEVGRAEAARYRALIENGPDPVVVYDTNGLIRYASPAVERMLGYSLADDIGQDTWHRIHPDDRPRVEDGFRAVVAARPAPLRAEFRVLHADGGWRWVEATAQDWSDIPNLNGVVVNYRDITDRVATEAALRSSEARVRAAFDDAAIGMAIVSLDGVYLRVNRALAAMLGYQPDDLVGMTWREVTHPDDAGLNAGQSDRLRRGEIASYDFEKRYLRRDGEPVWAHVTTALARDAFGEPLYLVTQIQDITARRAAERARDEERDLLRALMENVPHPIYFKDRDGRFTRVNAAAAARFGLPDPAAAVGLGNAEVLPPEEAEAQDAIEREILATGAPVVDANERQVTPDGEERWLLSTKAAIPGPDGLSAGLVGISRDVTEHYRAIAAVAESEARLRALLGRLPVLVYVESVDAAVPLWVGAHVGPLYGLDADTYARTLRERIHPDDRSRAVAEIDRTDRTGGPYRMEYRERTASGEYIWVRDHAVLVHDERGAPDYWLGVKIDITEAKRGEAALRDAEERYRRLVEHIPAVVYTSAGDDLARPTYVSPQIEALLGFTPEEWVRDAHLWQERVHPDDRERVVAEVASQVGAGGPLRSEFRFVSRDGRDVWVLDEAVLVPGFGNRPAYWQGFLVDIGDRRRAEEALREQAEQLAGIVATQAEVAAAQPDPDEVMHLVAERARALVGADGAAVLLISGGDLVYRAAAGLAADAPAIRLPINASLAGLSLRTGRLLRSDDAMNDPRVYQPAARRVGWRSLVVMPLRHRGALVGALQVMSRDFGRFGPKDVQTLELMAGLVGSSLAYADAWTAMREARDAAEEANRLKSQFLSTMSHELRTPMNAIIGYAHLLLDGMDGPLTPEQQSDVTRIAEGADRLLALIDDVLDLARIEAGRMELEIGPVDLVRVLAQTRADVAPQAADKGLALTFDVPSGLLVQGDLTRLRQVFTNLVGNAVKFTERGQVAVTATADDECIAIAIADSGIGIAADALPRVFEEFLQADAGTNRRYGGTGLGLAITRRLVAMHGGSIEAESEPGRGSVFTVRLPRSA